MQELFRAIWDTARFPVTAFPAVLRVALTFVMPIAFMTTVPAEALLGLASTASVVSAIGISGVMFVLSAQFWKLTIRNYSSASS
jgi:ABC-2 type transport system permease protein